jgi:hypothetical protein
MATGKGDKKGRKAEKEKRVPGLTGNMRFDPQPLQRTPNEVAFD